MGSSKFSGQLLRQLEQPCRRGDRAARRHGEERDPPLAEGTGILKRDNAGEGPEIRSVDRSSTSIWATSVRRDLSVNTRMIAWSRTFSKSPARPPPVTSSMSLMNSSARVAGLLVAGDRSQVSAWKGRDAGEPFTASFPGNAIVGTVGRITRTNRLSARHSPLRDRDGCSLQGGHEVRPLGCFD